MRVLCLIVAFALLVGAACQNYDPPPEVLSSSPGAGSITSDFSAKITVEFTEPIKQESLEVTLSKHRRDTEGNLLDWCPEGEESETCTPLLSGICTPAAGCPHASLRIHDDLSGFTLTPEKDFTIGEYVLRIYRGLEDLEGNTTGVDYDISFFVAPEVEEGQTSFPGGVMFTFMSLDKDRPFEFNFEVYFHIQVDQETGRVWGGGCDGDLIDPNDDRIFDPSLFFPNPAFEDGFKFVFEGIIQDVKVEDDNGNMVDGYYFENDPAYIFCFAPEVEIFGGVFVATMIPNAQTGRMDVKGTFSSPVTHIFDTPEHENPQLATGVMQGAILKPEEIGTDSNWAMCADPDPETITLPP